MESRRFCEVNISTEPPISIQKEGGEEIGVGLVFEVVERESWVARSTDGASTFVVDQRETSNLMRFFATSIPNPSSLQRFDAFIHGVILHLGIPNEFAYRTRVLLLSHVEEDIKREAKETEFKILVFNVLIELETQYRLVLGFGVVPATGFGAVPTTETAIASALSRKKFKKEKEGSQETCVICLEEFVENTQVNQLRCNHIFHKECIMNWLRESGFCPICRFKIQD